MVPWAADLCSSVTDLVQLEGASAKPADMAGRPKKSEAPPEDEEEKPKDVKLEEMDLKPLSQDPKMAPLRRAALHLVSVLLRSLIISGHNLVGDSSTTSIPPLDASNFKIGRSTRGSGGRLREDYFPEDVIRRMRITLGYTRATDVDDVVRVMSDEVLKLLQELEVS